MEPELQIAFEGYSKQEVKDILVAFRTAKYQVNRFCKVSLIEVPSTEAIVTIILSSVGPVVISVFLEHFIKRGKNILAKFFSPIKRDKKSSVRVTIKDQKGEKSTTIIAKDVQEFRVEIKRLGDHSKNQ